MPLASGVFEFKGLLKQKAKIMLQLEQDRVSTDFDEDPERLLAIRAIMDCPFESSTLVETYIRVITARNRTLNNYAEALMRLFLSQLKM